MPVISMALFGVGGVGSVIARGLSALPGIGDLWLFAVNGQRLNGEAMDLRIAAENAGNTRVRIHAVSLDIFDEDRTAEALARANADIIVNTATMRSWFALASALPADIWREIYGASRFGPWLPINLAPALKVMRARQAACPRAPVINVAFPDGVNPVLARAGLAPTVGAGNSEIVASVLRISAAEILGAPVEEIEASLVGHHYHLANMDYDSAWNERAFWYRLRHRGEDVTEALVARGFKDVMRRNCPHKSPVPAAVSTLRNVRRLLGEDAGRIVHCSAPDGLPGGFDVRFENGHPSVVLPEGLTMEKAGAVLHAAMQGDGIEAIEADGTVRIGSCEAEIMRQRFGYDCAALHPLEAAERGRELLARFDAYVTSHLAGRIAS